MTALIDWTALQGALLLFTVTAAEVDAVRADVIVLDGDKEGEVYTDTLIFPKVLQTQVKPSIGSMVLGRLGQGQKKPGQSPPWVLLPATEADKVTGRDWLRRNGPE
ncbi:UNVERIFIED_ORG: hypothetical protein E4P37_07885 [Bacillus sp. AZ43]